MARKGTIKIIIIVSLEVILPVVFVSGPQSVILRKTTFNRFIFDIESISLW